MDREGKDLGTLRMPDIEKIQCKNCVWREKDRFNGQVKGATLGVCQVYDMKPNGILWKNEECPYYTNESDDED